MGSCKTNARYNLSCLLQNYCHLSANEKTKTKQTNNKETTTKLSVSRQFSFGGLWRKPVMVVVGGKM